MCNACTSLEGAIAYRNASLKGDHEAISKALGVEPSQGYIQRPYYASQSMYA